MSNSAVMMAVVVLGILAVAAVGLVRAARAPHVHAHPPDLRDLGAGNAEQDRREVRR
jgi:hypothetical protein